MAHSCMNKQLSNTLSTSILGSTYCFYMTFSWIVLLWLLMRCTWTSMGRIEPNLLTCSSLSRLVLGQSSWWAVTGNPVSSLTARSPLDVTGLQALASFSVSSSYTITKLEFGRPPITCNGNNKKQNSAFAGLMSLCGTVWTWWERLS